MATVVATPSTSTTSPPASSEAGDETPPLHSRAAGAYPDSGAPPYMIGTVRW